MKALFAAPFLLLASACAIIPNAPSVGAPVAAGAGTSVPIGQPVQVGALVATPVAIVEDSRCPMNARCVWAGRLIVTTRLDGAGWRETVPLTLGEPHQTRGTTVTLVSGTPERMAGADGPDAATHFSYEGGA